MTVKPDSRLLRCAGFVSEGAVAADIGTDHAYLACFLVGSGRAKRVIASDIADGPLAAARQTVEREGLGNKITVVKSDGLKDFPPELISELTDVVIAGMGGEMIAKILAEGGDRLSENVNFILEPNTRAPALRSFLAENGYQTLRETAVRDGKFVYPIINAKRTGERRSIGALESLIGKLDPHEPDSKEYLKKEAARLSAAAAGMSGSQSESARKEAEELKLLAEEIGGILNDNSRSDL